MPGDPAEGFESKPLQNAAKTWTGEWWKVGGGGTPCDGIVYDPTLDRRLVRELSHRRSGGVLATAGNLVFQGRADGWLAAHRASNGTRLWQFDAGTGIIARP